MSKKEISLSPLESDAKIRTMVNLLSDKSFRREWTEGIETANALEKKIFELIENYGGSRDERLRIFHLIQIWGGFSGRNIYLDPENGFDWNSIDSHYKNLIDECRKIKDHSVASRAIALRAISVFNKNVNHIGISFITKHVRFWLYDKTGDKMLPIYDSVMAKRYMNHGSVREKDLVLYWDRMVRESEDKKVSLAQYERTLYNQFTTMSEGEKKENRNNSRG